MQIFARLKEIVSFRRMRNNMGSLRGINRQKKPRQKPWLISVTA
jgi:hypothetical protein